MAMQRRWVSLEYQRTAFGFEAAVVGLDADG